MAFFEKPGRCALVLTVLSLAYFAPVFARPREMLFWGNNDLARMAYPWRYYAVQHFQETGSVPLWFAPGMCGMPFEADCQTQLFYPPYALFYLLPLRWIGPMFGFMLWAHVLVAGLSMFGYARYRGLMPAAALVAAIGFMFAGKWLIHLLESGHYAFLPVAWFPLFLYCAERAIERHSLGYVVGAGVFAATIFTGSHPQLTLYSGFLACLLSLRVVFAGCRSPDSSLCRLIWCTDLSSAAGSLRDPNFAGDLHADEAAALGERPGAGLGETRLHCEEQTAGTLLGRSAWWLLTWTGAGSLAIALSAIQLLPAIELLPQITRVQEITAHFGEEYDLAFRSGREFLKRCVSLVGPQNFGGTPAETVGAWGVLWTGVALAALVAVRRKSVWLYAGLLLLAVLFSFNTATPVYPLVRQYVPGFALFRIPTRLLLFAGFPLGMLAGFLTEKLFSPAASSARGNGRSTKCGNLPSPPVRGEKQTGAAPLRTALALLAVAAGFLALSVAANWHDRFHWWPYWKFVAIAALVLAVVLYLVRARAADAEPRAPTLPVYVLWVALLTADLWYLHSKYLVTRSPDQLFPSTEVVEFLKEHPGDYRVINRNLAGPGQSPDALTQPLCILNRIDWVFGTNPTDLASYRQLLNFIGGRDDPPRLEERVALPERCDERLLDLLGARYLIVPADAPLSPDEESSWSLVRKTEHNRVLSDAGLLDLPPQNIFERTSPLPRAFVLSQGLPAPPRSELLHALQTADLRRTVFLDRPGSRFEPASAPQPQSFSGPGFQEARIVSRHAERVVIEIERTQPGYLVLLEAWYPGWRCRTAEGSELPVYRANSFFQAVEIPAGRQRLEFVFEPRSYRLGRWISLTAAALLACFLAATFVRSRNQKEESRQAAKPQQDSSPPA